jgi:hypothetical protein
MPEHCDLGATSLCGNAVPGLQKLVNNMGTQEARCAGDLIETDSEYSRVTYVTCVTTYENAVCVVGHSAWRVRGVGDGESTSMWEVFVRLHASNKTHL